MSEEQIKEQSVEEKITEVTKKVNELLNLDEMANLIQSNEIVFDFEGTTYKVTKPTFKQKQEAYKKRVEKFTELLRDEKYMLEEDLKSVYRKRGVDIDEIGKNLISTIKKRDELMFKLGEAISNKSVESDLQLYKKEIEEFNNEIQSLSLKKNQLLELSIENQVLIYTYSYLTFLMSEKKVGDVFVRVWNTWDEFQSEKENIINKLSYYCTLISNVE